MSAPTIKDRIDAALEKMRAQQLEVRAVYLNEVDYAALVKEHTRYWRKKLGSKGTFWPMSYGDHPIRFGERSRIYSTHGVEFTIPKRLSPRSVAYERQAA